MKSEKKNNRVRKRKTKGITRVKKEERKERRKADRQAGWKEYEVSKEKEGMRKRKRREGKN